MLPEDCETNIPIWGFAKPPACDRFMGFFVQTHWDAFVEAGNEFLDGPFQLDPMIEDLDRWAAQIEPAVIDDPLIDPGDWREQVARLKQNLASLIGAYEDHLEEGLVGF